MGCLPAFPPSLSLRICGSGHDLLCVYHTKLQLLLQGGKTKFTIENATKTRVVLADTRIHILGSFQNIRICRCSKSGLGHPDATNYEFYSFWRFIILQSILRANL